jgi:hypothetical protein
MKQQVVGKILIGALVGALLSPCASAEDTQSATPSSAATPAQSRPPDASKAAASEPAKPDEGKPGVDPGSARPQPTGVEEVLKMVKAGVSKEVIKTYVESSAMEYRLSAAGIIMLKEHAAPDEVIAAMLKRDAALRQHRSNPTETPPAASGQNRHYGALDPESYEYFQYYYLYPRSVAAANERLLYSTPSFAYYPPYGFYGGAPFRPLYRHP